MVGERSSCSEAHAVRRGGARRSENVGTSNHKKREIRFHRKPKVSLATKIVQGLVGPKAMAKAGADGQQVNIPARALYSMEGRSVVSRICYWIQVCDLGRVAGKSAMLRLITIPRKAASCEQSRRVSKAHFQEKLLRLIQSTPYRKPTQVGEASSLR